LLWGIAIGVAGAVVGGVVTRGSGGIGDRDGGATTRGAIVALGVEGGDAIDVGGAVTAGIVGDAVVGAVIVPVVARLGGTLAAGNWLTVRVG
jgi:hypothetical protein